MNSLEQITVEELVDFNPATKLARGAIAKKIPMANLGNFRRKINGFELAEYKSGPKFKNNDTLVAKITPCLENGKTAFVDILENDEVAFGSSEFIVLRSNEKSDSKFIYYLSRSPAFREKAISCMEGTSGRKRVNESVLKTQSILAPNIYGQRKIAAVLSALDDKIELNRRESAELEQMARTLYDYWFVQFDFPDAESKPYKTSGGPMKFSPELNRQIPTSWEVQDMSTNDLFDIIKPKIDRFTDTKEYIATADVNDLTIGNGSQINYETRESRANMQPKEYTVWFAKMKASVKHILVGDYSTDLIQNTIFSTGFMGTQTTKENFEYLALTIHHPYFELVKDANSNGATMEAIGNSGMKNIKLLVPTQETIKEFHKITQPLLEKIDRNRQQSQNLAHLRDWLLPMLMNGQVSVE